MVAFEEQSSINMFAFHFVAIRWFLAEIQQNPYLTLKIQGQGQDENQLKSNQVIYKSVPSILPQMKEMKKIVQNLSCEQILQPVVAEEAAPTSLITLLRVRIWIDHSWHITLYDIITYPCPRYLLVALKSSQNDASKTTRWGWIM